MNHISKIHQLFSEYLKNSRVLENPEEFLGENYEAVLNFWLILDDLSREQLKKVEKLYFAFFNENRSEWTKARDLDCNASAEVVDVKYSDKASWAACDDTNYAASLATREPIAMHKILEDHQQPLTFFPMFLKIR